MGDVAITSGIAGLVLLGFLTVLLTREGRPTLSKEALRQIVRPDPAAAENIIRAGRRHETSSEMFSRFYKIDLMRRLEEQMWQAGLYFAVADVLLVTILMFGAGFAAGQAIWNETLFAIAMGSALGAIPVLYVRFRRRRRLKAFVRQLPPALDLIKSSLEAGHSLMRGLQVVVDEYPDPIGSEFRSVIEQTRLGLPLPRAMEEMLKRVPEEDLRLLVVAVKVQAEVGSSLAQIIGRLSEIVRTRQRLQQQIHALTAQSRMSGMVVGVLPAVILAAFSIIQPQYTHTLFYDPTGIKILKTAIVLDVMAFLTIRRLLQIKY
jgi:tight adherence protein B